MWAVQIRAMGSVVVCWRRRRWRAGWRGEVGVGEIVESGAEADVGEIAEHEEVGCEEEDRWERFGCRRS